MACEANMVCGIGRFRSWDGYMVLRLMHEIIAVYGSLRTAHTSFEELCKARIKAERSPGDAQFDSEFVRELILSGMGISDTGYLQTRDEGGLKAALRERENPSEPKKVTRFFVSSPTTMHDNLIVAMQDACTFVVENLGYTDDSWLGLKTLREWREALNGKTLGTEEVATAVLDVCNVHIPFHLDVDWDLANPYQLGEDTVVEWMQMLRTNIKYN